MVRQTKPALAEKIGQAKKVVRQALARFSPEDMAMAWTGGKDSTLVLWLFRQVCQDEKITLPQVFSIDEYDNFSEVHSFMAEQALAWGIEVRMLLNRDLVGAAGGKLNAQVRVGCLNARNQAELKRLGFAEKQFPFEAESFVGNHLMKTTVLNQFIEEVGVMAVVQGLRWDEQPARARENYFSMREASELSPGHWRVNPILHFTERDVWDATHALGVPFNPLYAQGYRSLGAKSSSRKIAPVPAWEQELENTDERGGRRQDKEAAMSMLRDLGYM